MRRAAGTDDVTGAVDHQHASRPEEIRAVKREVGVGITALVNDMT